MSPAVIAPRVFDPKVAPAVAAALPAAAQTSAPNGPGT